MTEQLSFRSFSVYGVEAGLISNFESVIFNDEYFFSENKKLHSLLTNFHKLREIPFSDKHDFYLYISNIGELPLNINLTPDNIYINGNIRHLEESCRDRRKSIFGNMGLFSRLYLRALEKQGIYSFHSTSMYSPQDNKLYITLGKSGSGKSTVLLAGLRKGLQLFGSELTHFTVKNKELHFLKGSLYQNCRVGNLVHDFPDLITKFNIKDLPGRDVWNSYKSVDMSGVQTDRDVLKNPAVVLLFPRIEANRSQMQKKELEPDSTKMQLFSGLSQKITPPSLVYDRYFVPTVDNKKLQRARIAAVENLLTRGNIQRCWQILAAPQNCLDGIV